MLNQLTSSAGEPRKMGHLHRLRVAFPLPSPPLPASSCFLLRRLPVSSPHLLPQPHHAKPRASSFLHSTFDFKTLRSRTRLDSLPRGTSPYVTTFQRHENGTSPPESPQPGSTKLTPSRGTAVPTVHQFTQPTTPASRKRTQDGSLPRRVMHVAFRQLSREPDISNELTRPSLQFVPPTSKLSPVLPHRLLPRVALLGWCRISSLAASSCWGCEICKCSQFPTDSKVWIFTPSRDSS